MIASKERLGAVLNLSNIWAAQVVDLKVLGRQIVQEAQHVAEGKKIRSWHLAQVSGDALAAVGELP
eukprot:6208586-Pleurochrysis_carterae.AAC.1